MVPSLDSERIKNYIYKTAMNNAGIKQKVNSKMPISVSSAVCLFPFSSADVYIISLRPGAVSVVFSQFLPKQTSFISSMDLLSELGPWNCAQCLCFATGLYPLPVVSDKLKVIYTSYFKVVPFQ